MSNLVDAVGRLFIVGFPGEEPSDEFLHFVRETQLGGVIFFGDNCANPPAMQESIRTIRSCYEQRAPFMAIDQEGGRVCRLKGAPAEYRSAEEYGRSDNLERFTEDYTRSALYMESLGLNLNLAPVADIMISEDCAALNGRCFGHQPDQVAKFVEATVKVSRENGLLSCLKHFPGLGAAKNDPHSKTAVADYDDYLWHAREMIPFKAGVEAGVDMIMTTHLLVPRIDSSMVTESKKIVSELIRQDLSFDGPVITDDLTMKGADTIGEIGPRTVAAFNAGHDLLLFGQDYHQAQKAYAHFVKTFLQGDISEEQVTAALDRVSGVQCKLTRSVLR